MHPDLKLLAGRPVIVGAGLAGLMAALELAPRPVVVVAKAPLGAGCASAWAQGGLAAAVGADDSPELHLADTLAAGDGLCDEVAARRIIGAGPAIVDRLVTLGVRFGCDAGGGFKLKLEAAHCRHRVVNADGDGTGAEIMRAVVEAVRRTPSITVLDNVSALELVRGDGIEGVILATDSEVALLPSRAVVLATGGLGGLWLHTTNPAGALGQGVAMAARAGADLVDLEFMQFHPTALDVGRDPMPLATEALRGDGAILIDETGTRFMTGYGRAELEPRDIVARAVWQHLGEGHRVFLDTRAALGADVVRRFPGLAEACRQAGIDPVAAPIPICPAAHYHMGGIAVDARGRTSVPGLWACGEAAATGLHGGNRLASNSTLEAAVTGIEVGRDLAAGAVLRRPVSSTWRRPVPAPDPAGLRAVRAAMNDHVGVLRDRSGLEQALATLAPIAAGSSAAAAPALAGLLVASASWLRPESRGGHARTDFPGHDASLARRRPLALAEALALVDGFVPGRTLRAMSAGD
ncbi:MAG: L-aspartate oxidase [Aliidongia sp.]|nr:L-aspartate oxidase [Aliidongia sp.]